MADPLDAPPSLLLVDDNADNLNVLCQLLEPEGYDLSIALDGPTALQIAERGRPDLILLDVMMPGMDGYEVCRRLKAGAATASVPVIFITAHAHSDGAVAGFEAGAVDYITKPFREREVLARVRTHLLLERLRREHQRHNEVLRQKLDELATKNEALQNEIARRKELSGRLSMLSAQEAERWGLDGFVGDSPTVRRIFDEVRLMQENASTSVLITGESGTGKELIARAIHFGSARRQAAFVPLNCAALPDELVESMLFGHVKGAFTGAHEDRAGYFELAHEGTLFLDEIGDMPLDLQAKLLRVLEDGRVQRVGQSEPGRRLDVRVLAATNHDLPRLIQEGGFRGDLYFRLARYSVDTPPLRQRREDIPLLVRHFLALLGRDMGREQTSIAPEALQRLEAYDFPGNVRELKNIVERALIESRGEPVQPRHLHFLPSLRPTAPAAAEPPPLPPLPDDLDGAVRQTERQLVRRALDRTGGNIAEAARLLGTNRNRVYRILQADKDA